MRIFKMYLVILFGLGLFVLPQTVSAQYDGKDLTFCQNIDSIGDKILSSVEAKRQNNSLVDFDSQIQTTNQKLSKLRLDADGLRNRHFELIITKLKDPAQKLYVKKYQDAISEAVNTRRSSVDAAQAEFLTDLISLINEHRQAIAKDEEEFIGNIKQSITDAKQSCVSGLQSPIVRAQFASRLRLAKTDFAIKKKSLAKYSQDYRNLVAKRNIAIARAINTYQQSERKAKDQFLNEIKL
jgi:hypothetical protein